MFEDIYGKQPEKVVCASPSTAPERLKKAIFVAKTKGTAIKRLKRVMKLRAVCVGANPGADAIFCERFLFGTWCLVMASVL